MRPDLQEILAPPTPALLEVIRTVAAVGVEIEPTIGYLSNKTRLDVATIVKHAPRIGALEIGQLSYGALHVKHSGVISDHATVGLTVLGVHHAGTPALVDRFLESLDLMVRLVRDFEPTNPTEVE